MNNNLRNIDDSLVKFAKKMRRHSFALVFSLIFIYVTSIFVVLAYAQQCTPSMPPWRNSKTPDAQGLIHVTVNYQGGSEAVPNAVTTRLMKEAVEEWNAYKCTTGIVFDTSLGGSATLEFVYESDDADTGGCAAYKPSTGRIYHGPSLQSRLANLGEADTKAVFKHELGHFLGLDDISSPVDLMNQGEDCTHSITLRTIQLADAQKVASCLGDTPSCTPTPTPTPTPMPTIQEDCQLVGWYWSFASNSCDTEDDCTNSGGILDFAQGTCDSSDGGGGIDPACIDDPVCCGDRCCICEFEYGLFCDGPSCNGSPVIIDVNGNGFGLTDTANGVSFDLGGKGKIVQIPWTAAGSDDAFLVLDRNGNGG